MSPLSSIFSGARFKRSLTRRNGIKLACFRPFGAAFARRRIDRRGHASP